MKRILLKETIRSKRVILWGIDFVHSQIQELAESLIQDLNNNDKYNARKSHFSYINNSIILKSLMISPFRWALMGVIPLKDWTNMRMSLDLIDTAYNGSYFTISSSKRSSQVLVNHSIKYEDTYDLICSTKSTWKVKR